MKKVLGKTIFEPRPTARWSIDGSSAWSHRWPMGKWSAAMSMAHGWAALESQPGELVKSESNFSSIGLQNHTQIQWKPLIWDTSGSGILVYYIRCLISVCSTGTGRPRDRNMRAS